MENQDKKVLLKVEHLSQYFKFGKRYLRAVDDVNFEIYKGEVFGLVGESGCGKTTTGRTIIRLYDATGGSVYFDGKRIVAGTLSYKNAIKQARAIYNQKITALDQELKDTPAEQKAAKEAEILEKKKAAKLIIMLNTISGAIILYSDTPPDFIANSSFVSPNFPIAIIEARSPDSGNANGTSENEA